MDNKTKLLNLITELNLPLTGEDAAALVNKLSKEELEDLLEKAQASIDFDNELDAYLAEKAHEELAKLNQEYGDEIATIDEQTRAANMKAQEELDVSLDAIEQEATDRIDTVVQKFETDTQRSIDEAKLEDLRSKVN